MSTTPTSRRFKLGLIIALAAALAASIPMMAWITLHHFAAFDDEGYYLLALQALAHHHALYTHVYGTYGPAYYLIFLAAFSGFHLPFSADAARLITVVFWAILCLLSGFVLWCTCRSIALAVAAVFVGYSWLVVIGTTGELYPALPFIPLQLGLVIAVPHAVARRNPTWLLACGVVIGTILMIKVNIGVFTLAGIGVAIGAGIGGLRVPRWIWWTTCALAIAIPPVLLSALIRDPWVQEYLAGSEAAILALLVSARLTWRPDASGPSVFRTALYLTGGGLAACVGYVVAVAHAGTSAAAILRYTFIAPLNQTHAFIAPVPIDASATGAMILAALYVSMLVLRCHRAANDERSSKRLMVALALTKIAAGSVIILWGINGNFPLGPAFGAAWMGLAGFSNRADASSQSRRWVIWLVVTFGVFQQLQMYPVAGVQIGSGTIWFGLAGLIMVDDGLRILALSPSHVSGSGTLAWVTRMRWAAIARVTAAVVVAATVGLQAQVTLAASAHDTVSLGLRGSSWIHLTPPDVQTLESVTDYLQLNCSTFISAPGVDSLYTWSGEREPLGLLVDDWMYSVSAAGQRAVIQTLRSQRRVCAVVNPALIQFWRRGRPLPFDPVLRYLSRDFVRVHKYGAFEILLRR
jgi:hypothetical protein